MVVNVIGGAARTPAREFTIGGAVNSAMANFTKALADLGLQDDVNVNAVYPGLTQTDRANARFKGGGGSRRRVDRRDPREDMPQTKGCVGSVSLKTLPIWLPIFVRRRPGIFKGRRWLWTAGLLRGCTSAYFSFPDGE